MELKDPKPGTEFTKSLYKKYTKGKNVQEIDFLVINFTYQYIEEAFEQVALLIQYV